METETQETEQEEVQEEETQPQPPEQDPQPTPQQRQNTGRYLVMMSSNGSDWTTIGQFDKKKGEVRKQAVETSDELQAAMKGDEMPQLATVPVANFKISRPAKRTRESLTFE